MRSFFLCIYQSVHQREHADREREEGATVGRTIMRLPLNRTLFVLKAEKTKGENVLGACPSKIQSMVSESGRQRV